MNRSKSSDRGRRSKSTNENKSNGESPQTSRSKSVSRSEYGRNSPLFGTSRNVTPGELDVIVGRVTRPTVASRGGVDLHEKDFTYIHPKPQKTLLVIPGLERRYMGHQKVSRQEMDDIVDRLTRMTTAYDAKYGPDKNVWYDRSPQAVFKRSRSAKI
ncbi:hypothetical protein SNE40_000644 [Patella caerulea]|uniref:Uncharacterized protein n=1 Tax=Patella caerulea TaxID=87958 RepID=A0AAN8QH75_PATCE